MTSYIAEVRKNLKSIVKSLLQDIPTIRIGMIAHSDYCDHVRSYALKKLDLTNHLPTLTQFIEICTNGGGGDSDENYEQVLAEVRNLKWSKESSSKRLVMIGDADPHPKDSYFGIDWEEEVRKCVEEESIKIYGIQCGTHSKTNFYERIALESGGQRLMLSNFKDMVEVFVGLCYREDSLIHLNQKGEEILKKCTVGEEYNICLDDIGGRIDLFNNQDLIQIHNALHDPSKPELKLDGRPVRMKFSLGKAGVRYLRVSDLMFIQQKKSPNQLKKNEIEERVLENNVVTWISISDEYGYIVQKV